MWGAARLGDFCLHLDEKKKKKAMAESDYLKPEESM